tara:strand:+ start:534 stop:1751 length:1218 start_codon:yes stop_codon:yes gene_type:complete
MSTLKVDAIRHNSATSDAITTAADGTCTANISSFNGGAGFAGRNLILNGEFLIDQRMGGSTTAITPSGGVDYTIDMWHESNYGGEAARISFQQRSGDVPTPNYRQAIRLDVTTAMGTPSGNNMFHFGQWIESQNIKFLGHGTSSAKPITLQFWIKSTKTGTACVCIQRHDASREYIAEYTINQSDTWEKKTITIPGDTSGTVASGDNGRGFLVSFVLFAGSSRHGTVNTWRAWNGGYYGSSANQVNLLDSTSNFILFAGVQLEVGNTATPFEHKTFSDNLRECQRYYYQAGGQTNDGIPNEPYGIIMPMAMAASSTRVKGVLTHPVPMRAAPTISGGGSGTASLQSGNSSLNQTLVYQGTWSDSNTGRHTWVDMSPNSGTVTSVGESGILYANGSTYHLKVSAHL